MTGFLIYIVASVIKLGLLILLCIVLFMVFLFISLLLKPESIEEMVDMEFFGADDPLANAAQAMFDKFWFPALIMLAYIAFML